MLAVVDCDESTFFASESCSVTRHCVTLRSTSLYPINFKIRSTHPDQFIASPASGQLEPGCSTPLDVVIDALSGFDVSKENPKLKFTLSVHQGFPAATMDFVFAPFSTSAPQAPEKKTEVVSARSSVCRGPFNHLDPTEGLGPDQPTTLTELVTTPNGQTSNPFKARSEKVRVVVRIRPLAPQATPGRWSFDDASVSDEDVSYVFNKVVPPSASNVDTFNMAEIPQLLKSFTAGFNVALLMYGQTNSGKTHTMFGSQAEATGLIHCVLRDIFRHFDPSTDSVFASMLEIYNEEVKDLLVRSSPTLKVIHVPSLDTFDVESLSLLPINDAAAAILALNFGMSQGSTGPSHLNARSSRAHTIFRLKLKRKIRGDGSRMLTQMSELCFVDLAGSESLSEESNKRETHHINLSLAHLKRAIVELSHRKSFVSFRSSALTKLLKNSLQSNSRTVILCTISLDEACDRETRSTLIFGTMAKSIQNSVRANVQESADQQSLEALRKENEMLRTKVADLELQLSTKDHIPGERKAGGIGGADAAAEPMAPDMSIISPLRVYGPTISDFTEYLESEGKLSKLLAQTLLFLQSGCLVSVLLNSSARVGIAAYKDQVLHLHQIRGGEIVAERGLRVGLANVNRIVLGRRVSPTDATNSWRRRISLSMSSGHSPTAAATFSFQCKTDEDFEAWVVCLSQLAPNAQLLWDPVTMRKHHPFLDPSTAEMLSENEVAFCNENNVDPIGFVAAKNLVKSKGLVSLLQLRTSTNLTLFDANVVCEHFVQRGLLRRRTVLSSK